MPKPVDGWMEHLTGYVRPDAIDNLTTTRTVNGQWTVRGDLRGGTSVRFARCATPSEADAELTRVWGDLCTTTEKALPAAADGGTVGDRAGSR